MGSTMKPKLTNTQIEPSDVTRLVHVGAYGVAGFKGAGVVLARRFDQHGHLRQG